MLVEWKPNQIWELRRSDIWVHKSKECNTSSERSSLRKRLPPLGPSGAVSISDIQTLRPPEERNVGRHDKGMDLELRRSDMCVHRSKEWNWTYGGSSPPE